MNCIIIEDQPPAQRILKKYIEEIGSLHLKGTFSNPLDALALLKSEEIDLIFLDIHLPKMSGMDFLRSLSDPPQVILTTAFTDYAIEGYELNVVDYLLKPFSFSRFVKAVSKVVKRENIPTPKLVDQPPAQKGIFIKSGYEHIKVEPAEIIFIKADGDYTDIVLANKKLLSSEPLRYWLEVLGDEEFIRTHKSYIINISKIKKVTGSKVVLEKEHSIPIGRAYKDSFQERVLK